MNKKSFELSINFLVVIILAVTIMSLGIYLIYQIYHGSVEIKNILDQQTENQIDSILDEGYPIAVPINLKQVSRGESAHFGVGVLNKDTSEKTFRLIISFSDAFDNSKERIANANTYLDVIYDSESFSLKPGENKKFPVLVKTAKTSPSGTYIFNVRVDPYTDVNQLRIIVK